jgi:hypothetical protein
VAHRNDTGFFKASQSVVVVEKSLLHSLVGLQEKIAPSSTPD